MVDATQELEIENRIQDAICKNSNSFKQLIASILAVITLSVGVVLWATSAHAELKDWTASQDYVTRQEFKELIQEQYVPRYEFVAVKEKLDSLNEKHIMLMNLLDKMDKKLDSLDRGSKTKGK